MSKRRGLYEDPDWDESRQNVDPSLRRFDEALRFAFENISVAPYTNTTPFLTDDHRILRVLVPGVAELWIYFRVEPDDDNCTLLWIESSGGHVPFRLG